MAEFSLGKLLVLVAIILIVWYGFKYAARVEALRNALREEKARRQASGTQRRTRAVEDLVKCPKCGAFVAAHGASNCGKPGCPWEG
jgi:ribosomal protein L32